MSRSATSTRSARAAAGTLALIISVTGTAVAQDSAPRASAWEARVSSGALVGTGDQRRQMKDGQVTALQLSRLVRPQLALTGTFGWARSRDLGTVGSPKLDVFSTDLGLELRSAQKFVNRPVSLSTFAGLGGGARSYNYRNLDVAATHNLAGYASVGSEIGMGRVGLRLEARGYASGFKPLLGVGKSASRGDVVFMGALRFNRHRAAPQGE